MPETNSDHELELRLEKMRLEIAELKRSHSWNRGIGRLLPIISVIVPVLALLFAVQQFAQQQSLNRDALKRQAQLDSLAAERSFMQPVLSRQMNTYFEASAAAAKLASTEDTDEKKKAEDIFWGLYSGPLIMLESPAVSGAMKQFGACLSQSPPCDARDLQKRALFLSSTLQSDLFESWKLSPDAYAQRSINYATDRDKKLPEERSTTIPDVSQTPTGTTTQPDKPRSRSARAASGATSIRDEPVTPNSKDPGSKAPVPVVPNSKDPDSKVPDSKVPDVR